MSWLTSSLILIQDEAPANSTNLCNGATPTAKVAAANKGAHVANQLHTVEAPTGISSRLAAQDELDAFLRLEATLKAKIAALRTAAATTT